MNITTKVAGVTFEGRQAIVEKLTGDEPCRIVPEPTNNYDKNALAVQVALPDGIAHIGYIPRDLAALVAPYLDGETIMVTIKTITGGFETFDGERAAYGVLLSIELQDDEISNQRRGGRDAAR